MPPDHTAAVVQHLTQHPPAIDTDRRRLSTPVTAVAVTLRRPTLDEVFLDRTGGHAEQEAAA